MWQALLHFLHSHQVPNLDCVLCCTPLLHWKGQSYSFPVVHPTEGFLGEIAWVNTCTQMLSRVHGWAISRITGGLEPLWEQSYTPERSVEELWIYTKEFKIYLCTQSTTNLEIIPDVQKVHSSAHVGLEPIVIYSTSNQSGVWVCVGVWMKGVSDALTESKEMLISSRKNL